MMVAATRDQDFLSMRRAWGGTRSRNLRVPVRGVDPSLRGLLIVQPVEVVPRRVMVPLIVSTTWMRRLPASEVRLVVELSAGGGGHRSKSNPRNASRSNRPRS